MLRAAGKRLVEYRWLDWPLAAGLAVVHMLVCWWTGRFDLLRTTGFANRLSLYTDMITVTGVLFGFTATALASYLAFSGPRIAQLRAYAGEQIHGQWMSALGGIAATLGVLIICKICDREVTSAAGWRWVAEAALFLATGRMLRLLWVFRQIIDVGTKPAAGRSRQAEAIHVRHPV